MSSNQWPQIQNEKTFHGPDGLSRARPNQADGQDRIRRQRSLPLVLLQEQQRCLALLGVQIRQHNLLLLRGHSQQGGQLRSNGRGGRLWSLGLGRLRLRRVRLCLHGSLLLRVHCGLLLGLQRCRLLLLQVLLWQRL